jgi:hypothetical protein
MGKPECPQLQGGGVSVRMVMTTPNKALIRLIHLLEAIFSAIISSSTSMALSN